MAVNEVIKTPWVIDKEERLQYIEDNLDKIKESSFTGTFKEINEKLAKGELDSGILVIATRKE